MPARPLALGMLLSPISDQKLHQIRSELMDGQRSAKDVCARAQDSGKDQAFFYFRKLTEIAA